MSPVHTLLSAVSGGNRKLVLRLRVAHVWRIPDKERPNETAFMNMLLVDEKAGRMHGTVRKELVKNFQDKIEEGSTYEVHNVMVGFNEGAFKLTKHKYKLNLMQSSKFTKINAPAIPMNSFDFVSFREILDSSEEERIIDIIGHIVEKDNLRTTDKNGKKNTVIDLTLEDLNQDRIHCSLWGDFAEKIDKYFETHDMSSTIVLIIQFCKTRKYMGVMSVSNSFFGSKVILNGDFPEVSSYKNKMNSAEVQLTQGVSQMSGHASVPVGEELLNTKRMTIENLIESTEPCIGTVLATICEIENGVEWYFRSCGSCHTLVTVEDGKSCCKKCEECKTVVLRFKLHVTVMDETGSTTFVLFDRIVSQFIGRNVQDSIDKVDKNKNDECYPVEFNTLLEKQVLFKVEVSKGNVSYKWRTYAVKKASDDDDIIKQFISKYDVKNSNEIDVVECNVDRLEKLDDNPLYDTLEGGDSCSNTDVADTPTSKIGTKRSSDGVENADNIDFENGEASTTKPQKLVRVKIEGEDGK